MDSSQVTNYGLIAAVVLFFAWKKWRSQKMKPLIHEYLESGALVVDVRSPAEFNSGHGPGSLNIPLNVLEARMQELDKKQKLVVCCASGGRSGMALNILKTNGFDHVINAGPWVNAVKK